MSAQQSTSQMFSRIYNHESVKPIRLHLRQLKTDNEDIEIDARARVTKNNETMKSDILKMGQAIEKIYKENGMDFMISSVSENVIAILEKDALEDLIGYAISVLPQEYKNPNRSRAPQIQSKQTLDSLRNLTEKNIDSLENLDSEDDLKAAYELKLQELKKIEEVAEKKNHSLLPDEREDGTFNQLNELDRLQEERFSEKASIGEPLPPNIKEGETQEEYNYQMKRLEEAFAEYADIARDVGEFFTKKFPPTEIDTVRELADAITVWNRAFRPVTDDKFRRDWVMWKDIILKKITVSATNAAKVSGIKCAHIIDPKTGRYIVRHITKEQIDSMYVENWNYIIDIFNSIFPLIKMSEAFASNAARCREDRAWTLGPKLSHLS
jgi:hypothetical protein